MMSKKSGRPAGKSDAREKLLHHARALFTALPYSKVSTRMIAQRADVNIAMIRYYFGNKEGLFETMVRETLEPMHEQMQVLIAKADHQSLTDLMRTYYRVMLPNPNFPKLLVRLMMMEPTDTQRILMENIFLDIVKPAHDYIFKELKEKGVLREDVNPDMARVSFMSLMVFPFLVPQSMLDLHGLSLDDDFLTELVEHNIRLLSQSLLTSQGANDAIEP